MAEARSALRRCKAADARAALARLIAGGETDTSVFLCAGHLAESQADLAQATALYEQARRMPGPSAQLATLYVARLHFNAKRYEEARQLLEEHLGAWPVDTAARALQALTRTAQTPPKEHPRSEE